MEEEYNNAIKAWCSLFFLPVLLLGTVPNSEPKQTEEDDVSRRRHKKRRERKAAQQELLKEQQDRDESCIDTLTKNLSECAALKKYRRSNIRWPKKCRPYVFYTSGVQDV